MIYARARNIYMYIRAIKNKRAFNLWQIARRKKIEFFSNSPLRIKTAFDKLAAFPRKRELRSLTILSRKEKRLDALIA